MTLTESTIEQATIDWLKKLTYDYAFGPEIAFGGAVRVVRQRDGVLLSLSGRNKYEK